MSMQEGFKKVSEECKEGFTLNGSLILVEIMDIKPESKTSGLIYAGDERQATSMEKLAPVFAKVLMTGSGYYDPDTGEDVKLDANVGDVLLIADGGLRTYTSFGPYFLPGASNLAMIEERSIQMRFKGEEAFSKFFETLHG